MSADDELMTRREARQKDAEDECRIHGHDLEVSQTRSWAHGAQPLGIRCDRCGESWGVCALGTPYAVLVNGVCVARLTDPDDGLDPQYDGFVHGIALGISQQYDGLVTVVDERLAADHAQVAAFEDGKPSW